jgi:2-polyprenyl-6-methoxyphenol hydroxylase-like FAD-dependent oxidoreductase
MPRGFLAFGDAVCSFNPVYAQGMSVAAVEAQALGECLALGQNDLPRRFYRRIRPIVDSAWNVSATGDLRFAAVEGERTLMVRFVNWYLSKLHVAAHADPTVAAAFQRVVNMLALPTSVMHPHIIARVLRGNLRRHQNGLRAESRTAARASIP